MAKPRTRTFSQNSLPTGNTPIFRQSDKLPGVVSKGHRFWAVKHGAQACSHQIKIVRFAHPVMPLIA